MTDKERVPPGERWFAVYTKRQKEHYVDSKLIQLDLETFLPLIRTRIRRNPCRRRAMSAIGQRQGSKVFSDSRATERRPIYDL